MPYRSKKELSGRVRIVEIPGVDMCACCAPHVERTGEIGAIKVLDFMRHRGGTRLTLVCGEAAYGDYAALHRVNRAHLRRALRQAPGDGRRAGALYARARPRAPR